MMIFALATIFQLNDVSPENPTWQSIREVFDRADVPITALPHFSWHVANEYDEGEVERNLSNLVKGFEPFAINIAGIGIFTAQVPVLYLPVTKTLKVSELHSELWAMLKSHSSVINSNYDPHVWIPHVTLTTGRASNDAICRVITELAYIPTSMELIVDHLALIYRDDRTSGISNFFQFGMGKI
jgi:2'-5' RNA ligase